MELPAPELYYELLPSHYVVIHGRRGVKVRGLWYDGPALDAYRDRHSARGGQHKGRWVVRHDPRDARTVFFQDPLTHAWLGELMSASPSQTGGDDRVAALRGVQRAVPDERQHRPAARARMGGVAAGGTGMSKHLTVDRAGEDDRQSPELAPRPTVVLLDDAAISGEALRDVLGAESDAPRRRLRGWLDVRTLDERHLDGALSPSEQYPPASPERLLRRTAAAKLAQICLGGPAAVAAEQLGTPLIATRYALSTVDGSCGPAGGGPRSMPPSTPSRTTWTPRPSGSTSAGGGMPCRRGPSASRTGRT